MSNVQVSLKERVIHAVGFELLAAGIGAPIIAWVFDKPLMHTGALTLSLSLVAMLWNMIYNAVVDKWVGLERINWRVSHRIIHGVGFEVGIIVLCLPLGMYLLGISLMEAFLLEVGFFAFVLPYTVAYNWMFDRLRVWWFDRVPA